jgi:hypothetical protein
MGDRVFAFDENFVLSDGSVAYTQSGFAQYGGIQAGVDLGGNQSQNATITLPSIAATSSLTPQQPRFEGWLVVDVAAIKTSAANELYKLIVVASNDPSFGAGNVAMLGMLELGVAASLDFPNGITTPAPATIGGSRYELGFINQQNGQAFQFLSFFHALSGTNPSITYRAFVAVIPEP